MSSTDVKQLYRLDLLKKSSSLQPDVVDIPNDKTCLQTRETFTMKSLGIFNFLLKFRLRDLHETYKFTKHLISGATSFGSDTYGRP